MEGQFAPEGKERFRDVKLRVVAPEGDKRFMIGFDGHTQKQVDAYNDAIEEVTREADLQPFHQAGHENDPGYSAWECWVDTTQQTLEDLLPQIEEKAQEYLNFDPDEPLI